MTPSKRRRMGREAYEPGADPMDLQPYKKESWGYKTQLGDWLDGWKEAEETFYAENAEQAEKAEHTEKEQPAWDTFDDNSLTVFTIGRRKHE